MEKSKEHSFTGKSTCQSVALSKSKRDGSWQSATLTACLPPDGSIIYDEHQNILTGSNMISWPSMRSCRSLAI